MRAFSDSHFLYDLSSALSCLNGLGVGGTKVDIIELVAVAEWMQLGLNPRPHGYEHDVLPAPLSSWPKALIGLVSIAELFLTNPSSYIFNHNKFMTSKKLPHSKAS